MATKEEIQKAIEEKRKRESALEQVAAQQTQGMPMAQPAPNRGFVDKLLGLSHDEPTRRNQMSVVEGILNRPRGTTAIGGAASGMQRGAALMDEIRGRQRQEKLVGAQAGVNAANSAYDDTLGQYNRTLDEEALKTAAEKEKYNRQRDEIEDRQKEKEAKQRPGRTMSVRTEATYEKLWDAKKAAYGQAAEFEDLVARFEEASYTGGITTQVKEAYKEFLGTEDQQTAIIKAGQKAAITQAIQNLPPGVASDRDIKLVRRPQPGDFADPKYMAEYLRARAKIERLNGEYHQFVLDYMDQNETGGHSMVGVDSAWRLHKIPTGAKVYLRNNPDQAAAFDIKYGKGMAQRALR